MSLYVKIKEFFHKDWSLVDTEQLLKEKEEMQEHLISYRQTYQRWDSALGRMGLKTTIRKTEALVAEIDAELNKRGVAKD